MLHRRRLEYHEFGKPGRKKFAGKSEKPAAAGSKIAGECGNGLYDTD